MRNAPGIIIGLSLIVIGLLFLLDNFGYIEAHRAIGDLWPLILVIIGISFLLRGRRMETIAASPATAGTGNETGSTRGSYSVNSISQSEMFGDILMDITSQEFTGGNLNTMFGDIRVDLTKARLQQGEHHLRISTLFGDSKIDLPEGMEFGVQASSFLGDIKIKGNKRSGFAQSLSFKTPGYAQADRKLNITISQMFGDTKIY